MVYSNRQTYREVGTENHRTQWRVGWVANYSLGLFFELNNLWSVLMKKFLLGAAILAASIGSANASVSVFSDNFDSNALGLNAIPSGWAVTGGGTVDIIGSSNFFDFIPGNGRYIDLDGSTSQSGTLSRSFSTVAGNIYTAMFELGGGHRGQTDLVSVNFGALNQSFTRNSSDPFTTETMTFTASANGTASLSFLNAGGDNMGALLDRVNVTAVPEAEEWAMMMLGLGMISLVAKRKQTSLLE
jgi:hypothetical protein